MSGYDLLICGGTLVDGTGAPRRRADVGVRAGRVAAVGKLDGATAGRRIDARGLIVAPGVIDPHTHYDAQVFWDPYCTNSGWHGVTSIVVGNCGFGFSPCHKEDRERYMLMMENTEQIPLGVMRKALPWNWESYPEWVKSVAGIRKGINLGSFLPLNSLMIWVMGYAAAKTRPATEAERAEMRRLLIEAMDCGALGFGFSYLQENNSHKDVDGSPMITDAMHEDEALNLARVLAERGEGAIQALVETDVLTARNRAFVEKLAKISGRPVLHTVIRLSDATGDHHRSILAWLDDTAARGLNIYSQALAFRFLPMALVVKDFDGWQAMSIFNEFQHPGEGDTLDARVQKARCPDFRARARETASGAAEYVANLRIVSAPGSAHFTAQVGKLLKEVALADGQPVTDVFFDLCAQTRLACEVCLPRETPDPAFMAEINAHPRVLPGTSDGGAHVKFWSGGQYGTDLLSWLVRDEGRITLEHMHYKLSKVPAEALGWRDRGSLVVGSAADIMVYDLAVLGVPTREYETVWDLPGNDWRRIARAQGIRHIVVNGQETFTDNVCTGATPGQLLGLAPAPVATVAAG